MNKAAPQPLESLSLEAWAHPNLIRWSRWLGDQALVGSNGVAASFGNLMDFKEGPGICDTQNSSRKLAGPFAEGWVLETSAGLCV